MNTEVDNTFCHSQIVIFAIDTPKTFDNRIYLQKTNNFYLVSGFISIRYFTATAFGLLPRNVSLSYPYVHKNIDNFLLIIS